MPPRRSRKRRKKKVTHRCMLCPQPAQPGSYVCTHHRRFLFDAKRREKTRAYRRGPYKCGVCGKHGHTTKTHKRVMG